MKQPRSFSGLLHHQDIDILTVDMATNQSFMTSVFLFVVFFF